MGVAVRAHRARVWNPGELTPGLAETVGALQQQGVDEGLGKVAAKLALHDVVLLGEQPGRSEGGAVAFEPAQGVLASAQLQLGQGHEEPAQDEGALGFVQGPVGVAGGTGTRSRRRSGPRGPR